MQDRRTDSASHPQAAFPEGTPEGLCFDEMEGLRSSRFPGKRQAVAAVRLWNGTREMRLGFPSHKAWLGQA
jgi:hypothetical protein